MSGQTLREVLVKIALEMDTKGFRPPDFSGWQKDLDKAKQSGDAATQTFDELIEGAKEYAAESDKAAAATRKRSTAMDADSEISKKWLEREQQRAELVNQVAAGSLKAARGVAFLTAANQEEYQATLRWIAGIQGVMDTFTGILDVYKSLIAAKRAAAAATAAETAAEVGLATARGRSAGAGIGGQLAGMGRSAISLRGGAVLAGGLALGYGLFQYGRGLAGTFQRHGEAIAQRMGFMPNDPYAGPQGDERQSLFGSDMESISRGRAARDAAFNRDARVQSILSGPGGFRGAIESIDRRQARNRGLLNLPFEGSALTTGIERQSRELEVAENSIKLEEERKKVLDEQSASLTRQLEQQRQLQSAAHELLRVEEDRFRTMEERIGRLAPQEVDRLRQIAERQRSGGTLSLQEAQFLEQTGIGGAIAAQRFRAEGQARGASGILAGLGEDQGVNNARANLRSVEATAGLAVSDIQADLKEIARMKEKNDRDLVNAIEAVAQLGPKVTAAIADLQKMVSQTNDELEKQQVQNRELRPI